MDDDALDGSLHYLRGEYEGTREVYRTRRNEMPEAQVKMNVRRAGDNASIIDVEGELTAFAEAVLMDAYNQASDGQVRAIILNFEDLEYMNSQWHRVAGHAAHPHQPREAEATDLRPQRALQEHLPDHTPRRRHSDPRLRGGGREGRELGLSKGDPR